MRSKKRSGLSLLEDIAHFATGTMNSFEELRGMVKGFVHETMDRVLDEMDLVTRDEFERVERMAEKARLRQEELEERLDALEGKPKKKKRTTRRTTKKTTTTRRKTK
ncbi:MAG: accessory factor UbiK family protein [Alphaproteobacteria bacterium]|nr:accessory factor UbiK family protein [Alphaproteobacteria bacterium]